jgi:hypothetical protein
MLLNKYIVMGRSTTKAIENDKQLIITETD